MPRLAAGAKSALSRKEQNRINQRAFRERKRQELDDMRKQIASMKATNADAGAKRCSLDTDVDHTKPNINPCDDQSNISLDDTICPASLMNDSARLKPSSTGDQHNQSPPLSLPQTKTCSQVGQFLGDDTNQSGYILDPQTSQVPWYNPVASNYLPSQSGETCIETTWPTTHVSDVAQQESSSSYGFPPTIGTYTGHPIDLATEFANAQEMALKSAEWYAKAAEVVLQKIATIHGPVNVGMSTWQQCLPSCAGPTNYLELESRAPNLAPSLPCDQVLLPQQQESYSNYYEPWLQEPSQIWQWDAFSQPC